MAVQATTRTAKLRVEPNGPGKGYELVNHIKEQAIPTHYITPIKGVREALEHGILVGHPMVDIKVTLFDGSHHEADSNEIAFKDAPEKLCQYSSSQE